MGGNLDTGGGICSARVRSARSYDVGRARSGPADYGLL
jgi:hypothetical protein